MNLKGVGIEGINMKYIHETFKISKTNFYTPYCLRIIYICVQ